ncbi:MAG: DUF938 domain-containing protein [Sphingobium sp.]
MSDRLWFAGGVNASARQSAPAALRNRDVIADVLAGELPAAGLVLEIASGSGEHVVHFARRFPTLEWQPSDPDPVARSSVMAHSAESGLTNVRAPLDLNGSSRAWSVARADALICINMTHISPWAATVGLFTNGAKLLSKGAPLILYGPYIRADQPTAPGNLAFDTDLRARNRAWGLRRLEDVTELAESNGFIRAAVHEMPANNLVVVFRIK